MVKKNQGKVLKDITIDIITGNNEKSVSERTVKKIFRKNKIYRRVVRKHMFVIKQPRVQTLIL